MEPTSPSPELRICAECGHTDIWHRDSVCEGCYRDGRDPGARCLGFRLLEMTVAEDCGDCDD